MPTHRKNQSDWWSTMEHIGLELRKLYPSVDVPPGLHALFTKERRRARAMHGNRRHENKDNRSKP
jgi:hypothetical protein